MQPIGADGKDVGRPLVAVDSVGAGVGETVFFVRGKEASFPFHPTEVPTDAGIVGIVDHYTVARLDAMILARVVGTVVATQKRPQFEGAKLLLVQPETPQGEAKGATLLAIDSVGAGVSERVHRGARRARRRRSARQEAVSRRRRDCWYRRSAGVRGMNDDELRSLIRAAIQKHIGCCSR